MYLHIVEETTSSNDLAKEPQFTHGSAIWALCQSAGRGQRGNKWSGGIGENIAFSVVLEPKDLAAQDQFRLAQITALALYDTLQEYGVEARIKWTNDIYIGDHKVAGVLIENTLREGNVARSVIGIGININQRIFDESLPNPTSISLVTGKIFDREEVLRKIYSHLMRWLDGEQSIIVQEYNAHLYRRDEEHHFRLPSKEIFRATIEGVAAQGELQLRTAEGGLKEFLFREVEFVIKEKG